MQNILVHELSSGDQIHLEEWPASFFPREGDKLTVYGPTKRFIGTVKSVDSTLFCDRQPFLWRIKIYMTGTSSGHSAER